MPLLQFLPWCRLSEPCEAGDITLIPFKRDFATEELDALQTAWARSILNPYKQLSGFPVHDAVLVRYRNKDILDDLDEEERGRSDECVELAAFSSLAKREFFIQLGRYSNFDQFRMYGHMFEQDPARSTLVSRRPDREAWSRRALAETVFSQPLHTCTVSEVELDVALLSALVDYRSRSEASDWNRWQNAIICFNRANTDDPGMLHQVEWILMCSAFEHLLGAKPKAKDVAQRFQENISPELQLLAVVAVHRREQWRGQSLRYQWLREFHSVRGDFAHGRLVTQQPMAWNLAEHLLLARIAFPILVRTMLSRAGRYELTEDDEIQLHAFERFVDSEIFPPPNQPDPYQPPPWRQCLEFAHTRIMGRTFQGDITESCGP